jgi:hypothetical protein
VIQIGHLQIFSVTYILIAVFLRVTWVTTLPGTPFENGRASYK